jgi:hypothetical protein
MLVGRPGGRSLGGLALAGGEGGIAGLLVGLRALQQLPARFGSPKVTGSITRGDRFLALAGMSRLLRRLPGRHARASRRDRLILCVLSRAGAPTGNQEHQPRREIPCGYFAHQLTSCVE